MCNHRHLFAKPGRLTRGDPGVIAEIKRQSALSSDGMFSLLEDGN